MDQILEFVIKEWLLVTAFVVIAMLLVRNILQSGGADSVSPQEAVLLLNRENAAALDVRPKTDFDSGHLLNAIHIPLAELKQRADELKKMRDRPLLVCCATGTVAAHAVKDLRKAGFAQVSRLRGGIAAWRNENLPLTQKK